MTTISGSSLTFNPYQGVGTQAAQTTETQSDAAAPTAPAMVDAGAVKPISLNISAEARDLLLQGEASPTQKLLSGSNIVAFIDSEIADIDQLTKHSRRVASRQC